MAHLLRYWHGYEDAQLDRLASPGGTAPTFDASTASYSERAAKWDGAAAGVTGFVRHYGLSRAHWWVAYHVYLTSLPTAGNFFYLNRIQTLGGADCSRLRVDSAGVVSIWNVTAGTWENGTGSLLAGVYYVISHRASQSILVSFVVRERDSRDTIISKQHSVALGAVPPGQLLIGPAEASRGVCSFDNVVIEADDTLANIDDPVNLLTTNYAIAIQKPNGTGFYNQWTGSFLDLDEYPGDGVTTSRSEITGGEAFTELMSNVAAFVAPIGIVHGLQAWHLSAWGSGGGPQVQMRVRSGAVDSDGGTVSLTATYDSYEAILFTDPNGGGAWTADALDGLELGLECIAGVNTARCTQIGAEVLYEVALGANKMMLVG